MIKLIFVIILIKLIILLDCGELLNFGNGKVKNFLRGRLFGLVVVYLCDNNYGEYGFIMLICLMIGVWMDVG